MDDKRVQLSKELDYSKGIRIGEGIYWIGYDDHSGGLHANPYMIVEGDEAVVIDAGSRPDFSTVMMKILQAGVHPGQISRLIYQHYDPDLVGSVANFENVIDNPNAEILSQRQNNIFIHHYATSLRKRCINDLGLKWAFSNGRQLHFINTPYAHSPGSFVTYDAQTKTLFSSDLFGYSGGRWSLYLRLSENCKNCWDYANCPEGKKECFMPMVIQYHKLLMTSTAALRHALDQVRTLDIERIAPQHGSIIEGKEDIQTIIDKLYAIEYVGIDCVLKSKDHTIW